MAKKKEEAGTMTKADAVRAAMAEGVEKPQDACEWIKSKFDIDITPAHFSSYKSGFKKKESSPNGGRVSAKGKAEGGIVDNGSPVELARQVKQLVDKFGARNVQDMIGVFTGD